MGIAIGDLRSAMKRRIWAAMAMRGKGDADWKDVVEGWKRAQGEMRQRMKIRPLSPLPRFVAGADAAFSKDKSTVFAAAVVYDRIEQRIVEVVGATAPAEVPYVPGFLSFREGPAVLAAIAKLKHEWGAICFDGQGYAHPRRCGLATHLAVTLDVPGVGVGKSRLIGTFDDPPAAAGAYSPLMDNDDRHRPANPRADSAAVCKCRPPRRLGIRPPTRPRLLHPLPHPRTNAAG
jgi:deoxyinosine 3'endonuclease (endonuclease V)